jgi:hypothetical protein
MRSQLSVVGRIPSGKPIDIPAQNLSYLPRPADSAERQLHAVRRDNQEKKGREFRNR